MSYLYKKAEEKATTGSKIDPNKLQAEIDKRNQELDQLKGSVWANQEDRTLLAALIGAGVGGVGGLLLAPKSETKNNFKRKLRYALLGAGIGGLGGAGLMYGGIGGLIDGNITSKQEEINELVQAKNLDGSKVSSGVDAVGEIVGALTPEWAMPAIHARNATQPVWLGINDTAALATGMHLGAGTLSAIGAGAKNLFRGNGPAVSKGQAFIKGIGNGFGKRTGIAAAIGIGNAILKSLTSGDIEQPKGE